MQYLLRYFVNIHDEHNPSRECVEIQMAEVQKGGRDHVTATTDIKIKKYENTTRPS